MSTLSKTVVDLDLVGYSSIAQALEKELSAKSTLELNDHIKSLVDKALAIAAQTRANSVVSNTGDGAIIWFDQASTAYQFCVALQDIAHAWNILDSNPLTKRFFRIGVASGLVEVRQSPGELEVGGYVISRSVRLQTKAAPGSILIDDKTYENLDRPLRLAFKGPEWVTGKRDEVFKAYRCICHEAEAKQLPAQKPVTQFFYATRGIGNGLPIRKEIMRIFASLRPHQYEDLIFILNIPFDRRPSRLLPLVERRGIILEWIAEEKGGVEYLKECLELVANDGVSEGESPKANE